MKAIFGLEEETLKKKKNQGFTGIMNISEQNQAYKPGHI